MATLNEITYDVLNTLRGGQVSDDELISLRQIQYWVHTIRAKLIREDIDKRRSMSDNVRQNLGCVPVEYVDLSLCCGITTGCKGLRTVVIPKTVESRHKDMITRVGPVQLGAKPYTLIPYERAAWVRYNTSSSVTPKAFLFDQRIHLIMPPDNEVIVKYINVQGVFEDPTDVKQFSTCEGQPCYSDDDEYPISAWMLPALKQLVLELHARVAMAPPTDSTGDAHHGLSQPQSLT